MTAYVITYLDVTDAEAFAEYQAVAFPTIEPHGGRLLASGDKLEVMEGILRPQTVVIIAFDSIAQAKKWYASPEYAETIPMRQRAASASMIFVEGLPPKLG
ncbi:DUF1330 domain-containing protein [Pseudomonas saliphila]|uniref:DUF1330 domain-containing protein n=1 Tax=Pseudomonas saliphila TaxID=2586906 RepID=UPI0015B4FA72|nr:DUF1330 domain-containing protein [Pseudomonas saliphila]